MLFRAEVKTHGKKHIRIGNKFDWVEGVMAKRIPRGCQVDIARLPPASLGIPMSVFNTIYVHRKNET